MGYRGSRVVGPVLVDARRRESSRFPRLGVFVLSAFSVDGFRNAIGRVSVMEPVLQFWDVNYRGQHEQHALPRQSSFSAAIS